jgi:hypothetical protein
VTNQSPFRGITPAPGISLSASSDLRHRAESLYDLYDPPYMRACARDPSPLK